MLNAGQVLTLRVQLGWRADFQAVGATRLQLSAVPSGTVLAARLVGPAEMVQGQFVDAALTAVVPFALAGQGVRVSVIYEGRAQQVSVDNVRVEVA